MTTALALVPTHRAELVERTRPARNAAVAYFAGLTSPASRTRMLHALRTVARLVACCEPLCRCKRCDPFLLPWHELDRAHTAALRSLLAERCSPASANLAISGLRGVLRESWRLGLMDTDAYTRAADLKRIKATVLLAGRMLSKLEIRKLFATCDASTPQGARDAAVLAVLRVGLRRNELVSLDVENVSIDETGAAVLEVLHGKGRKARVVTMPAHLAAHLSTWLELRGDVPGALFFASDGLGHGFREPRRPTTAAIFALCRRLAVRARVARFSPHDWRRTMISELLDAGADISSVQRAAGHSSVTTTQRYDRRGESAVADALALLS